MELERQANTPRRRNSRLSTPARIVVGALAIFGAVTLVQWVLTSLLSIVKFGLLVVVIIGVAAWVVSAKASR